MEGRVGKGAPWQNPGPRGPAGRRDTQRGLRPRQALRDPERLTLCKVPESGRCWARPIRPSEDLTPPLSCTSAALSHQARQPLPVGGAETTAGGGCAHGHARSPSPQRLLADPYRAAHAPERPSVYCTIYTALQPLSWARQARSNTSTHAPSCAPLRPLPPQASCGRRARPSLLTHARGAQPGTRPDPQVRTASLCVRARPASLFKNNIAHVAFPFWVPVILSFLFFFSRLFLS